MRIFLIIFRKTTLRRWVWLLFLFRIFPVAGQSPAVAVSSYYNAIDPRDEWTELLVTSDNTSINNWTLQDNNSTQTSWQPAITFSNAAVWNHLRAGTIIVIWHRAVGSTGAQHPLDTSKADGYLEVSANHPALFTGGSFGTAPLYAGATLNISATGDLIMLNNASGTFVHVLGHQANAGASWTPLPTPKLNFKGSLTDGVTVNVCPGSALNEYGSLPPQDGTTWASSEAIATQGLPNNCSGSTANSDFWRSLREPFTNPTTLTATVNGSNTSVLLTWNAVPDAYPQDGTMGYMLLRSTTAYYGNPLDGQTYQVGERMSGNDTVIALIPSSQTTTYTDNVAVPCGATYFYRIFAYRYSTDEPHGNLYHVARGRAYNQGVCGMAQVTVPGPMPPLTLSSDRDNFCSDDPGNITLTVNGGSGTTLHWYSGSCGGVEIGNSATSTALTIPSPDTTTTYYARWENSCGFSTCVSMIVSVIPVVPVSVTVTVDQNPVCTGIPVTFSAAAVNPGTSPVYAWKVNGAAAGSNTSTFTYSPADGDLVWVVLSSNVACPTGNPAVSDTITMSVSNSVALTATLQVSPGDTLCAGTAVILTSNANNGGANPGYEWFLNGLSAGVFSQTWTYIPADGDRFWCRVTSASSCVTNSPANSDTVSINVVQPALVSVSVAVAPNDTICSGTAVTFTATPTNEGVMPHYQWYLNQNPVGTDSPVFTFTPANGDSVFCTLFSGLTCTLNNPDTSEVTTLVFSTAIVPSLTVACDRDSICPGARVTFTADPVNGGPTPLFEWRVDGVTAQSGSSSVFVSNSLVGTEVIRCRLTSSLPCAQTTPVESNALTMYIARPPVIHLSLQPFLCLADTLQLDAGPGFISYEWQDGSTGRFFTPKTAGVCRVEVTDSSACHASDSVLLKICDSKIYVPNAFTPNGDGLNDEFRVINTGEGLSSFVMNVFDRWGRMIFESTDEKTGWTGRMSGEYAPAGSYVWQILYRSSAGAGQPESATTLTGSVELIR
ncbi:MAG TPA: gliding motility-associated C-terminal domain-containing protein [Bacteroidales bacterium]|nr:gliding motility-associated C-terminal domain-containing protein [Bacteroidales bacterium]